MPSIKISTLSLVSGLSTSIFALPSRTSRIRRCDLRLGEAVVIFGMGIVGHLTALFCRLGGACPVIAVDSSAYRLDLLPQDSLLVPIDPSVGDLHKRVHEHTRGRMADVVIEATGLSSSGRDAPESLEQETARRASSILGT